MMGWLARIAGPKVLLGISVASVTAIAVVLWLYVDASRDAASAEERAQEYRQALESERETVKRLQDERRRLEQAIADQREAHERARERTRDFHDDLGELAGNPNIRDWFGAPVPPDLVRRLRQRAGQDEAGASDAPESIDEGVPDSRASGDDDQS